MSKYQTTQIEATQKTRCRVVHIEVPGDAPATIRLVEETVANVAGTVYAQPAGEFLLTFDPSEKIAMRDPYTDELNGEFLPCGFLQIAIRSFYRQKAEERDAIIAADAAAAKE